METVKAFINNLFGWLDGNTDLRTSYKRDRDDDEFSSDDELPSPKRNKQLKRTIFPDIMASDDPWQKEDKHSKNVRYVPIQIESSQPSTSTPIEIPRSRVHSVPIKLVSVGENGVQTPSRKPRMHTPVRPVLHALVDDNGDDEQEVTWIEADKKIDKQPKYFINLVEEDNQQDNDVVFVKKVTTPPPKKPYKFFVSKNEQSDSSEEHVYYKVKKSTDINSIQKFKAPPGITKSYRKPSVSVSKWMQTTKMPNTITSKSKILPRPGYSSNNGKTKSTIYEVFNLEEKKNYRELIKRVTESIEQSTVKKKTDFIDLAGDAASFRQTQRAQKKALNDIIEVEKGLSAAKDNNSEEYDPITVASINSSDSEIEIVSSETTTSSVRISPINTLRDSLKDEAILAGNWLSKIDAKYRKKKQEKQEQIKEARRESDIISKINSEQKIAQLEHKLKYELSIPESLIEEPQPVLELPKLTPEQEKLVNRALGSGPGTQVLVEKFNLRITRRDLQTLSGLNWLNDEVINFYMNLLMQRSEERKDLPKVYATNTFFYPKLMQSGQAGLRRWTRKVDVFAHDLMVVPVHLGVHWCLSLVDFREKKISYLDSMGARNDACLDALLRYLRDEHQDKKGEPFDDKGWQTENLRKDIPQQMNGSDCGMFACTFAEFSARNAPYTFTQSHMPYLRRKVALEILTGKLLL